MRKFKSIKRLKVAPQNEIIEEIGVARAEKIENYFKTTTE